MEAERNAATPLGFTLIELLIAIAIVGFLAAIAIPSYQSQSVKARRSDGQAFLLTVQSRIERYMYDEDTYPTSLADLGYDAAEERSQEGFYRVSIKAATSSCPTTSCYVLVAEPLGPQTSDGNLELHSSGTKVGHWR